MPADRIATDTPVAFEALVASAFPRTPDPRAAEAIDSRVRALASTSAAPSGRVARRRRLTGRAVLGLALALLALAAAGGGLMSLYRGIVDVNPAFRLEWDRATPLGISQSGEGYRTTVERAYADIHGVMVAVSVSDSQGCASNGAVRGSVVLTDDLGGHYEMWGAASDPNDASSAANVLWFSARPPLLAGPRTFHLTLPSVGAADPRLGSPSPESRGVAGPFTFTFPLEVHGGSSVAVEASTTHAGTVTFVGPAVPDVHVGDDVEHLTVRIHHISATDATIRATIEISGWTYQGADWSPIAAFVHGGSTFAVATAWAAAPGPGTELEALASTSTRSGPWTLRIDEIVADVGVDGAGQIRVAGPWVVPFSLP